MGIRREGKYWRVQVQVKGRRVSTTTRTREEAEQIQAKVRRDRALSRQGLPAERSLEEALTRWLDEYVPHLRRGHNYQSNIRAILPYCGTRPLEDAPEVWREYLEKTKALKSTTNNRRGAVLRRVCSLAEKWGWCLPGLAKRIELLPENSARHVYLTATEFGALLKRIDHQPTRDLCSIVAYTGLRPDEVMNLTRADVMKDCLIVRKSKTGRPRVVPCHDAIRAAVRRLPLEVGYRSIARHFERARDALRKPQWHLYDLRHTAASWLIQAGADMVTVRDMLGHTSVAMTSRYSHLSVDHLRLAVNRIRAHRR